MKHTDKNRNHHVLCYYAMNNHMYLIKDKASINSMVEKAKSLEHKTNTSLLGPDEIINHLLIKNM